MTRGTIVRYLCIPAALAVGALVYALRREPLGLELFLSGVFGGFLFYAAPFLVWALVVSLADFSSPVNHAGFIAAAVALAALTVLSFMAHDPSGLPIQWLIYWPFAIALQVLSIGTTVLYVHWRSKVGANGAPRYNDACPN